MSYIFYSYTLYKLVMVGWTPGSRRGRGRLRKHGLPPRTRSPPTTSTAPASTTLAGGSSVPHGPHIQEFVMMPNPGYHNSKTQLSFSRQVSPPPPHLQEVRPAVSLLLRLPLVSLVRRVPRPPCPPLHRAPRTSEWSLDTTVNPYK